MSLRTERNPLKSKTRDAKNETAAKGKNSFEGFQYLNIDLGSIPDFDPQLSNALINILTSTDEYRFKN